ncbi:MAG: Uma2 family endonuclease, partial [Vicinamibacterales bacterium]|nr:Uma2 family endonuclease [Vicinamibacterales bacterium]
YLAAEAKAEVRHEYLAGDVWAMAGGTIEHGALMMAAAREIGIALRGKPCRAFSSDVRIRIPETDLATYPDLSVVCGRLQTATDDDQAITNPILVVEVLSDSTEAYDRGAKWAHYRRIASLREYVLVSQGEPLVELYRRTEGGRFELLEARAGQTIELASIGATIAVDALYVNPLEQPQA